MNPKRKRVLIVGGGITGLTLAYRLQEKFFRFKENTEIILVESSPRIGGIIETEQKDEFILEKGPDSFFNSKPNVLSLCEDLQIKNRIISTNPDYRRSFILQGENLIPVPKGFYEEICDADKSLELEEIYEKEIFGNVKYDSNQTSIFLSKSSE